MIAGNYHHALVESEMPQGFYLLIESERILLPGNKAPSGLKINDKIKVFVYHDNKGRLIATTQKAKVTVNHFAILRVKEVNPIGAFLDWGLDKDLFLPYKQQLGELQENDMSVVYVVLDKLSNRLVATEKIKSFLDLNTQGLRQNQKVELAVYEVQPEYIDCLIDYRYTGRYYFQNQKEHFYIGDTFHGYIQSVREDNKVSLSLNPVGYRANIAQSNVILEALKKADGFLAYGDFSEPQEINQAFGLSKKKFKQMIGHLFKKQIIYIDSKGIYLNNKKNEH